MNSFHKKLANIFVGALVIRLLFALICPLTAPDTETYAQLGIHLVEDGVLSLDGHTHYPRYAPLYPFLIGLSRAVSGMPYWLLRILQCFLDALTCVMCGLIARRFFSERAAVLTAVFCALLPHLVVSASCILTETVYTFLLVLCFYLITVPRLSAGRSIAGGLALGLANLCRPVSLLLPVVFMGVVFFRKSRQRIRSGFLLMVASAVLAVVPTIVINYAYTGALIPVAVGSGFNLWVGSYRPWDGDYNWKDLSDKEAIEQGRSLVKADREFRKEALRNIRENPLWYAWLVVRKIPRLWLDIPGSREVLADKPLVLYAGLVFHNLFLLLCGAGWFLWVRREHRQYGWNALQYSLPGVLITVTIVYFTGMHVFFLAIPRYVIPVLPLCAVFAGFAVCCAADRCCGRHDDPPTENPSDGLRT